MAAAAKKTPAKTPEEKPTTKAVANPIARLAALAQEATNSEPVSAGSFISTKGGQFSVGNTSTDALDVVILDWVLENHVYASGYDPDKPAIPACYAFGRKESDMAPHAEAKLPQHDKCATCPLNQFGSADVGKGKACKNVRRLLVIMRSALEQGADGVKKAEKYVLKLSPTSLKGWTGYVAGLNSSLKLPPLGVVTQLTLAPIPGRSGHKTEFSYVEEDQALFTDEVVDALLDLKDTIKFEDLAEPYKEIEEAVAAAPAKGAKPAIKGAPTKGSKLKF